MTNADDEFFVGYFKMSARSSRFAIGAGIAALLLGLGLGVAVVLTQQNPGPGLLPHRPGEGFRGLVLDRPYPHMRYFAKDGTIRTLLLTSGGKFGITPPDGREGRTLEAKGTLLQRDMGRILAGPSFAPSSLESSSGTDPALRNKLEDAADRRLGKVRLEGEIVDSKCYFGSMRPGGGRGHRACAQMCISGGIPPLLVVRDGEGGETHVLLCSPAEEPVNAEVLPFVAEPVAIEGDLLSRAGMLILKFEPEAMERL